MRKSPRGNASYIPSATVRTTWTWCSPAGAGAAPAASCSPVSSRQRSAKCSATSATAGPRSRVPTSCHPSRGARDAAVEAVPAVVGHVDPAHEGHLAVDDHRLLVVAVEGMLPRVGRPGCGCRGEVVERRRDLLAGGVKGGREPPPRRGHGRRSVRPARPAAGRRTVGSPRTSSKDGARCHPVMWTNLWASPMARAIAGRASAPSIRTCTRSPSAAGGQPAAQSRGCPA